MVQLKAIHLRCAAGYLQVEDFIARFITLNTMRINPWHTHEIKISPFVVSAVVATFHPPRPPTTANQEQHSSTPPFTLHAIFSTIYFNLLLPSSSVHFVQEKQQRRNKDSQGRLLSVLYSLGHCLWKEEKFNDYSLRIRSWKKKELLQQKAKVSRALLKGTGQSRERAGLAR